MPSQHNVTFDALLLCKDAGSISSSAAAQVSGTDKIIDLGTGRFDGALIVDVTAVDSTTGDEVCYIECQFSDTANFAAVKEIGSVTKVGGATGTGKGAVDAVPQRRELPFCNEFNGVLYRYFRVYTRVAGTSPSVNYVAFIAKGMPTAN